MIFICFWVHFTGSGHLSGKVVNDGWKFESGQRHLNNPAVEMGVRLLLDLGNERHPGMMLTTSPSVLIGQEKYEH